jgi:hypothetical protein
MTHQVQFHDTDASGKPVHEYSVAGMKVPSVTYVLDKRGFCNYADCPEDYMEAARERGQIGHEVTHWFDEFYIGELFESPDVLIANFERLALDEPLHPWARTQLEAWIRFRIDFGFVPLLIEKPAAWKIQGMLVCGTPDRYGISKIGPMVIELKFTSKIERSCQYQTAAYAANEDLWVKGARPLRYAAHFKNGKVIPVCFTRTKDEKIFSCALSVTHDLWNQK